MSDKVIFSTERLSGFTDAVVAIVITLLVLTLTVPTLKPIANNHTLWQAIQSMSPSIFSYVLSFILIACYWMIHNVEFRRVERIDARLIWLNMGFLLFLSFLPFPTEIAGKYTHVALAMVFFNIALCLPALMLFLMNKHVRNAKLLSESKKKLKGNFLKVLPIFITALISSLLCIISVDVASWSWLLMTVMPKIVERLFDRDH